MAFFGVTRLGYQDTIRENVRQPELTPQHIFRSGLYRDPTYRLASTSTSIDNTQLDENITPQYTDLKAQETEKSAKRTLKSHAELQRLKERHATKTDYQEVYRRPIVSSADIARWRKDEPLRINEPWSNVERKVHHNSEMTKFVDQMALTNPQFSLF
jgi:hypothetical protein